MLKGRYENSNMGMKVVQWIGIVFILTAVVMVIWSYVPDRQSVAHLKAVQVMQTLSMFLLPSFIVAYLWSEQPVAWLHLDRLVSWKEVVWGLCFILIAAPGINLLADLNSHWGLPAFLEPIEAMMKQMEVNAALLTEKFLQMDSLWALLVNLLVMALLPALSEELCFRGVMTNLFYGNNETTKNNKMHIAIWVVAVLFSAMHMQFDGFVPRMLLGAVFGYALWWSGSLWLPIWMHFVNNSLAVISAYMEQRGVIDADVTDQLGTGDTLWLGIVSIVLSVIMLYVLRKQADVSFEKM